MVSKWMKENVIDKGIENVRFFAQVGKIEAIIGNFSVSSSNKTTWVECKITEDRYKVSDGYKITLQPLDYMNYVSENYYQSDFESLINSGNILMKENDGDCVEHIKWIEPLCGSAYLIHEADVIKKR